MSAHVARELGLLLEDHVAVDARDRRRQSVNVCERALRRVFELLHVFGGHVVVEAVDEAREAVYGGALGGDQTAELI